MRVPTYDISCNCLKGILMQYDNPHRREYVLYIIEHRIIDCLVARSIKKVRQLLVKTSSQLTIGRSNHMENNGYCVVVLRNFRCSFPSHKGGSAFHAGAVVHIKRYDAWCNFWTGQCVQVQTWSDQCVKRFYSSHQLRTVRIHYSCGNCVLVCHVFGR